MTKSPMVNELIDIRTLDPSIRIDLRYASLRNFTGKILESEIAPLLRRDAAMALARAHRSLKTKGFGLKIWDAYRSLEVQKKLWEAKPDPRYVHPPDKDPKHCLGIAVDLTLVDAAGRDIPMPTDHDEFIESAASDFKGLSDEILQNRELLVSVMEKEGFKGFSTEWWHYEYPTPSSVA